MKKYLILIGFSLVTSSVFAAGCTRWYDEEGFERVRCDPDTRWYVPLYGTAEEAKYGEGYLPKGDEFTVYDQATNSKKRCMRYASRVVCE